MIAQAPAGTYMASIHSVEDDSLPPQLVTVNVVAGETVSGTVVMGGPMGLSPELGPLGAGGSEEGGAGGIGATQPGVPGTSGSGRDGRGGSSGGAGNSGTPDGLGSGDPSSGGRDSGGPDSGGSGAGDTSSGDPDSDERMEGQSPVGEVVIKWKGYGWIEETSNWEYAPNSEEATLVREVRESKTRQEVLYTGIVRYSVSDERSSDPRLTWYFDDVVLQGRGKREGQRVSVSREYCYDMKTRRTDQRDLTTTVREREVWQTRQLPYVAVPTVHLHRDFVRLYIPHFMDYMEIRDAWWRIKENETCEGGVETIEEHRPFEESDFAILELCDRLVLQAMMSPEFNAKLETRRPITTGPITNTARHEYVPQEWEFSGLLPGEIYSIEGVFEFTYTITYIGPTLWPE